MVKITLLLKITLFPAGIALPIIRGVEFLSVFSTTSSVAIALALWLVVSVSLFRSTRKRGMIW